MPSIRRTIRRSLLEVLESKTATNSERLEAGGLLLKIQASATKSKPRGRAFAKKATGDAKNPQERLSDILAGVN
jgi:hypothetical protein